MINVNFYIHKYNDFLKPNVIIHSFECIRRPTFGIHSVANNKNHKKLAMGTSWCYVFINTGRID